MSKAKINKVVPEEDMPNSKNPSVIVAGKKYFMAPTKIEENYTGFPIHLYFVVSLPEANHDYEYLKINIKVESSQSGKIINEKQEYFKEIIRGNLKREMVFEFTPTVKGNYTILADCSYRARYFVQSSQPPPEKRDSNHIAIKCEEPFIIKEHIVNEDKSESVTFPLFLQYSIESRLSNQDLNCEIEFKSEKLKFKELHNEKKIKLRKDEAYYLMLELEPKNFKEAADEKGATLGTLVIRYGNKAVFEKRTALKKENRYVFFKAQFLNKDVPKKDIAQVEAVFTKIYSLNFNLRNMKLVINEKEMPDVKIIKTSVDTINLDQQKEVKVTFTVICLKSGPVHLKGISLQNEEDNSFAVYFINELILNVGVEPERKAESILENTSEIMIDHDLI